MISVARFASLLLLAPLEGYSFVLPTVCGEQCNKYRTAYSTERTQSHTRSLKLYTQSGHDQIEEKQANVDISCLSRRDWIGDLVKVPMLTAAMTAATMLVESTSPEPAQAVGTLQDFEAAPGLIQRIVLNVPDIEAAVTFCTIGLEMKVLGTSTEKAMNHTLVGYGPLTLDAKSPELEYPEWVPGISTFAQYGGHACLELVGPAAANQKGGGEGGATELEDDVLPFYDGGDGVAFIQVSVPSIRISKIIASGGELMYGYGYSEIKTPWGLQMNAIVGETRDPFTVLALRSSDTAAMAKFLENTLKMKQAKYPQTRGDDSPFEPPQPPSSMYFHHPGQPDGLGILVLPSGPLTGTSTERDALIEEQRRKAGPFGLFGGGGGGNKKRRRNKAGEGEEEVVYEVVNKRGPGVNVGAVLDRIVVVADRGGSLFEAGGVAGEVLRSDPDGYPFTLQAYDGK